MGLGLKKSFYEEDNIVVTGVASVGEEQEHVFRRPPYLVCVEGKAYMQFRIFVQPGGGQIVVLHPLEVNEALGDTWAEEVAFCAGEED